MHDHRDAFDEKAAAQALNLTMAELQKLSAPLLLRVRSKGPHTMNMNDIIAGQLSATFSLSNYKHEEVS